MKPRALLILLTCLSFVATLLARDGTLRVMLDLLTLCLLLILCLFQ